MTDRARRPRTALDRRPRRAARASVSAVLVSLSIVACAAGTDAGERTPSPWRQTAWAVRGDTLPAPSSPDGLERGGAESVRIDADRPFRLRFEVEWPEAGALPAGERFGLEVRRNGGAWEPMLARDFPYPDEISTPRSSVVHATAWRHGDPAGDLLDGSGAAFAGGGAVAKDSVTAPGAIDGASTGPAQTEWEWAVVVRLYADGGVANAAGDAFEFRMVDGAGRPVGVGAGGPARVELRVPDRHLGGTYVETPGVLGPWQAPDGALYFPMEPAETYNVLMMVKSVDGGRSWVEVDGRNRPLTDDLEGFATAAHGGRVWMLHQISEAVYLHAFATTDAEDEVDRWVVRDELVAEHSEPPTQVAALVAHPDGRLVAVYADSLGMRSRVRATDGTWGEERRVDGPAGTVSSGVMAARGADGRIHLAYTAGSPEGRDVWYRTLSDDGVPGGATRIATGVGVTDDDIGAVAPLVHLPDSGVTVVLYRLDDGFLYSRSVLDGGSWTPARRVLDRSVVQNGSDSEQVGVDAVGFDGRVIAAVIDEETRDLRLVEGRPDASGAIRWAAPRSLVDDVNAQWVRGAVIRRADGTPVYGIVYDAGSDGGAGMNRYVEWPLN